MPLAAPVAPSAASPRAAPATQVREQESLSQISPPAIIIGVTGNALLHGYDQTASAAGQDLVWGKPIPTPDQIRAQLRELFAEHVAELERGAAV